MSTPPADADAPAAPPARDPRLVVAVGLLALFALVAALYLARGFFIPLLIGILTSYTLRPVVDWLKVCRIPRSIGAALVLALVVGAVGWIGVSLGDDAQAMIEKLPEAARKLRRDLSAARAGAPTALQKLQEAANELQGAAADAGDKAKPRAAAIPVAAPAPTWLRDYTIAQSAAIATGIAQAPIVLLLAYFLLASGTHFRRKLLQLVGPSLARKKEALGILDEIDVQVQRYLLGMLAANTLLAAASWLVFFALGLEQAGVWGVAAGVLHFIPYIGPALIALGTGVAAFLQSGSLLFAFAVAGASLLVAAVIGLMFMTWLQSRFSRVNAAVLFIALLFFGWLWGVWGLLLGAPLLAIGKVIFDRVQSLNPLGDLLGR